MRFHADSQPVDSTPLSGFEAFANLLSERHQEALASINKEVVGKTEPAKNNRRRRDLRS